MAQLLTVGNLTNSWNFIFGDSNWKFCKVGYPIDVDISDVGFALFLFLSDFFFFKPVGYTRTMSSQTGKNTK